MPGDVKAFIQEIKDVESKYGLRMESCGCCGSPYLIRKCNNIMVAESRDDIFDVVVEK